MGETLRCYTITHIPRTQEAVAKVIDILQDPAIVEAELGEEEWFRRVCNRTREIEPDALLSMGDAGDLDDDEDWFWEDWSHPRNTVLTYQEFLVKFYNELSLDSLYGEF